MADDDTKKPDAAESAPEAPKEEKAPAAEEKKPAAKKKEAPAKEEKPAAAKKEAAADEKKPAAEKAEGEGKGEAPAEGGEGKKEEKKDIFAEIMGEDAADKLKVHKAKGSKNVTRGIVHVTATFNNTIVSVTDQNGNSIGWSSGGKMGFKGSRKSTAYAGQVVSQDACRQAMSHGLKEAEVRVKGPGAGRESAVRALQGLGIEILGIKDVTPIPHNGCRPKKSRRV
ncbi:MAG: 30S ribosomal protein S11 [Akkermansiaceae bacterium]|nr:30S ribosomal protein S11 [Akkermansiaceae bacterium]